MKLWAEPPKCLALRTRIRVTRRGSQSKRKPTTKCQRNYFTQTMHVPPSSVQNAKSETNIEVLDVYIIVCGLQGDVTCIQVNYTDVTGLLKHVKVLTGYSWRRK